MKKKRKRESIKPYNPTIASMKRFIHFLPDVESRLYQNLRCFSSDFELPSGDEYNVEKDRSEQRLEEDEEEDEEDEEKEEEDEEKGESEEDKRNQDGSIVEKLRLPCESPYDKTEMRLSTNSGTI